MTTILFPASTSSKKSSTLKKHYPVVLGDIVRGCSDSIDALQLFGKLLRGQDNDPTSLGFLAFDAHVGDTACQLRAGMMREAFSYHQQLLQASGNENENPAWIDEMVSGLETTKNSAQEACLKITKKKVRAAPLGFHAKTAPGEKIAEALGWLEPEVTMWYHGTQESGRSTPDSGYESGSETSDVSRRSQSSTSSTTSTRDSSPSRSSDSRSHPVSVSSLSSRIAQTTAEAIQWNLLDPVVMVRFIVYSFVLSKYKYFFRNNTAVAGRLDAAACAKYGEDLIKPYNDVKNSEYAPVKGLARVEAELHAMQVYISELSTSWLSTLAARSSFVGWEKMMNRCLRRAVTKHASMPAYLGFLLMREELSAANDQVILVDRHFCKDGFHSNVFIAQLELQNDEGAVATTGDSGISSVRWRLEHAPVDYLIATEHDTQPHVVIMGNSIDGSYADYMVASHPDSHTSLKHEDLCCPDNESHIADFLVADHDRIATSFMASHKHFAFPLTDPKEREAGEARVVYDIMEDEQPGLGDQWQNAKDEAVSLGCVDDNIRLFSWQHIVLETRSRLGQKVAERKDMMPLCADSAIIAAPEAPKYVDLEEVAKPSRKERRDKSWQPTPEPPSIESSDAVVIGHPSDACKTIAVISVLEVSAVEETNAAPTSASATPDDTVFRL